MEKTISIALPINPYSHYDIDTCFYLLESIRHFFDLSGISVFYILCERAEIGKIKRLYKRYINPLKIEIVAKEDVLPDIQIEKYDGWLVQQLLKIAISNFIKTDFYLVLDCDAVCCRQVNYEKIINSGKIINGKQLLSASKIEHFKKYHSNLIWMKDSAKLLMVDENNGFLYGLSPMVMASKVCQSLQEEIKKIGQSSNWAGYLLGIRNKFQWSEFGLYYCFLRKENIFEKYYNVETSNVLIDFDRCIVADEVFGSLEEIKKTVDYAFSKKYNGFFMVIQDYTGFPLWRRNKLLWQIGRHFGIFEHLICSIFALENRYFKKNF